jgi:hypothetical protein
MQQGEVVECGPGKAARTSQLGARGHPSPSLGKEAVQETGHTFVWDGQESRWEDGVGCPQAYGQMTVFTLQALGPCQALSSVGRMS